MRLWKRARMWILRRRFEQDLAEEVRIHREMSGAAAFGSEALVLEQSREVWGLAWLNGWSQDIRYAVRGLRRSPGFAGAVIAAIGLGIGLNTTLFTAFNAYVLRPYAVHNPYALYSFVAHEKTAMGRFLKPAEYDQLREQRGIFADVMAFDNFGADLAGNTVFVQLVSENYFHMLGVGMEMGRPLLPGDKAALVLSYDTWRNRFGADPSIVGRKLYMRGQPFEVAGVADRRFAGLESFPTAVWIPLAMQSAMKEGGTGLRVVGRLGDGVGVDRAKAELLVWARRVWPETIGINLEPHATRIPLSRDTVLWFVPLFAAFFLVLLIACANVSNMMLARALARQREIAIRLSLGAARWRLVRQLLTESAILALPSAAAGFLISEATIEGARRLLFATIPPALGRFIVLIDLAPDWRVFGYILACSVATALLFGLVPALQTTRSRLVEANRGDFSSDYRPARLRSILVVAQAAICGLLLTATAVVLRSEDRVSREKIALDTAGVWDLRMQPRFQERAAARLAEAPGMEAVAAAWRLPLYGTPYHMSVTPSGSAQPEISGYNFVSAGYFRVFRIPVIEGRLFSAIEGDAEAPVVVVSESAARRLWPGRDAVGETIAIPPSATKDSEFHRWPGYASARVVGIVRDAAIGVETDYCIYFPTGFRAKFNDTILARMAGNPADGRRRLERTLEQVAPSLADMTIPMDDMKAFAVYPFRAAFWIAGFLGGVALLLTVTGIYGVISYAVSQRTKEIGIRVALGANASAILGMVLRQSVRLAGIGVVIGAGLARMAAPVFANQMEAIQPYEMLPYVVCAVVVLLAAVLASYAPSRRALRIDPVDALRCD
jgi:predicted permease